jgi:hypothetical protein
VLVALAFPLLPSPLAACAAIVALVSPFAALAWLDRSARRARARVAPGPTLDALRATRQGVRAELDRARRDLGLAAS